MMVRVETLTRDNDLGLSWRWQARGDAICRSFLFAIIT